MDDSVEYRRIVANAGGDETKAFDNLVDTFFGYNLAAGSVEGIGDLVVSKTLLGTKGLRTLGDVYSL